MSNKRLKHAGRTIGQAIRDGIEKDGAAVAVTHVDAAVRLALTAACQELDDHPEAQRLMSRWITHGSPRSLRAAAP